MTLVKKIISGLLCLFFIVTMLPINATNDYDIYVTNDQLLHGEFIDYSSDYVYLYDVENQKVVYEKNGYEQFYPASLTKMMTLLVGIENISDVEETVTLESSIFNGLIEAQATRAGFGIGDEVKVIDLFYGIMLPSGAECTRAIAQKVAGSEEAYVELMNQKASELGMNNTHFVNTSGLHDQNHYSTPHDMALLVEYAIKNPLFAQIYGTYDYRSSPTQTYPQGLVMESTTKRYCTRIYDNVCPSVIKGSKTGFTNPAQYCLASVGDVNGHPFILVTGHSPWEIKANNVTDAVNTYTWMADNQLTYQVVASKDSILEEYNVKGTNRKIRLIAQEDIGLYSSPITVSVKLNQDLVAPLYANTTIGHVIVENKTGIVGQIPIVVEETIDENNLIVFMEKGIEWLNHYWLVITGCGIVLFGLSFVWIAYEKKKARARRIARMKARRRAMHENQKN